MGALAVLVLCYANPSAAAAILITADTGLPITQFPDHVPDCHNPLISFPWFFIRFFTLFARVWWTPAFHGYSIYIILYPCQERKWKDSNLRAGYPANSLAGSCIQPLCHICPNGVSGHQDLTPKYTHAPGWIWTNNVCHQGHGFTDRLLQPFAYRRLWREAGEASVLLCQYYSIWTWADLHYF